MFERVSQILGLFCYGFEGIGSSYLFLAPIFRGPFGTETLTTIVAWTIAAFSVAAWFALFRKESRVRSSGKVPPFSGNIPRLAIVVLIFGVLSGSISALVFK